MTEIQHISRCPHCSTLFGITAQQSNLAKGWMRCGNCFGLFQSLDSLIPNPPLNSLDNPTNSILSSFSSKSQFKYLFKSIIYIISIILLISLVVFQSSSFITHNNLTNYLPSYFTSSNSIKLTHWSIQPHPIHPEGMQIQIHLENNQSSPQILPSLKISQNNNDNTIERVFTPLEYLSPEIIKYLSVQPLTLSSWIHRLYSPNAPEFSNIILPEHQSVLVMMDIHQDYSDTQVADTQVTISP